MIKGQHYTGVTGLTVFTLPELANVTILTVARGGRIHTQVSGTPGDLEFKYNSSGSIEFAIPFESRFPGAFSIVARKLGERIYIKYKA